METVNLIYKLRKINRKYAFNIFRVRIGGLYMALFFLFEIGSRLVGKFVPMSPEVKNVVCETLSCIACLILGEEILRSLFKLLPRYCWGTLLAMIGGAIGGLTITIIMDYFDSEVVVDSADFIALGVCIVLFGGAYLLWRHSVNKAKQLKLEREMARKKRR
jgi:predicted permease